MNIYELFNSHPLISLFLVLILLLAVIQCLLASLNFLIDVWVTFLNHLSIRSQGWPPPWCDAEGYPYDEDQFVNSVLNDASNDDDDDDEEDYDFEEANRGGR